MAKREEEQGGNKNKGDQDEELEEEEEDSTEGEDTEDSDSDAEQEGDGDDGTEDADSDDDAEEEVDDEEEDDTEEEDTIKIKPTDLAKMIEKRVKKALQKAKDSEEREKRKKLAQADKGKGNYRKLYEDEVESHTETKLRIEELESEVTIQNARNQAISYALAKHPDAADGIDEWVVPKIEKQIRELEDPEDAEIMAIVKREVQTYAQQFDRTQKKKRQTGDGIPSGASRTQMRQPVSGTTSNRVSTMMPRRRDREAEERDLDAEAASISSGM
jgi:hypothetical protein